MAQDVDLQELDMLKAYSTKLGDFQTGVLVAGGVLLHDIRKLQQKLEEQERELSRLQHVAEERAGALRARYERALEIDASCRDIIGDSDQEADKILDDINDRISTAQTNIRKMQMLLENILIRSKGFVEQVPNMVGHSRDSLGEKIQILEEYKEHHKS